MNILNNIYILIQNKHSAYNILNAYEKVSNVTGATYPSKEFIEWLISEKYSKKYIYEFISEITGKSTRDSRRYLAELKLTNGYRKS